MATKKAKKKAKKSVRKKSSTGGNGLAKYRRFINSDPAVKRATKQLKELERKAAALKKKKKAAEKAKAKKYKSK